MMMNDRDIIKELIDSILLGKQYELVGNQDLVTAGTTYRSLIGVDETDVSVSEIIIDRFGRYPHRNKILGREATADESIFLLEPNSNF